MKKNNKMFINTEFLQNITDKKNKRSPLSRQSLIIQLAVRNKVSKNTVNKILQDFFYIISKNAKMYSHVSLYGFGNFREKKIKKRFTENKIENTSDKREEKKESDEKSYLIFKSSFKL